jgi:hypothetical protein
MKKRSRHYGDIANWIEKVIDSCKTRDQVFSCQKLIHNFENTKEFKSLDLNIRWRVKVPLEFKFKSKLKELMYDGESNK